MFGEHARPNHQRQHWKYQEMEMQAREEIADAES